jgi:DegV family protein with EDD domain
MVKILVDTASDIDLAEANDVGVNLAPIQVRFGDEEYLDGVNLSHRQFFEKLIESDELPKTSQINEFRFDEMFTELTEDGSEVVAITLSSKLSGTYNCAVKSAQKFGGKVVVVDSLNACIGERILCQYALRLAKEGTYSAKQIAEKLDVAKKKIKLLALLDTLEYLKKGGRISSVVALAGKAFSIKPVVSIVDGEVKMVGKAIGSKKGNNLLNELVAKSGGIDFDMPYALGYSGLSDEFLNKYISDSKGLWVEHCDSLPSYMIGSTIGTHIGPNGIAVAFFGKE